MSCYEKVAGTCHSERSEESEVGHASRLVEPDASLPLILRFTQDDMSVGVCNGMLSEAKHLDRHATPSLGNQMLRFTQHDIFAALTTRLIAALPGQAVDKLVKGFATIDTDAQQIERGLAVLIDAGAPRIGGRANIAILPEQGHDVLLQRDAFAAERLA